MREIGVVMDAAALRDAQLSWQAAQFMRFAYHRPNDMPECPGSTSPKSKQSAADAAYVRAWMKAMHNRSRDHEHGS